MNGLISAVQFLTVFRLKKDAPFLPEKMVPFFPVVGIGIGLLLAVFDGIIHKIWGPCVVSVLDVVFLAWITGALHLDGLGDTADGLYGNRPPKASLLIMKDSRIGAMGMIAIFIGLAVKWAALGEISTGRHLVLIIVPAYARSSMLVGMRILSYCRDEGTGKAFVSTPLTWWSFRGLSVPLFLSLLIGIKGMMLIAGFVFVTGIVIFFYKKRMNCITGDMLGAMCEICEAALFLIAAIA